MRKVNRSFVSRKHIVGMAALAAIAQLSPVIAGTTPDETTISTAGSTALKNWFVKNSNTFTDITPGTTIDIGGVQYPSATANASTGATGLGVNEWEINGGTAFAYQLAPNSYGASQDLPTVTEGKTLDVAQAVRFEYHESGSVEGILELANDQIAPVTYVTQNINRDPNSGNAVWVNYQQFGGGNSAWTAGSNGNGGSGTVNGMTLGEFYANGQQFTLGGTAQPAFNLSGGNLNGGQNAVQLALSDAIPLQVFAASNTSTSSTTPWTLTPQNSGYGQGNTKLNSAELGTASLRAVYQSAAALNMPSGAINPRTGAAFGTGAWSSAGLGNLTSQTAAVTATEFVANPGTGLTQLDQTDAQWLETTGRLQNGATFNMTTRDVNSGTRDVSSLDTGLDPTWSVGLNDDGNGNAPDGATTQVSIGPGLRFSNKTSGGNELRPTVQVDRMAVGTLSVNDATGYTTAASAKPNPLRPLAYSASADGSTPYVLANYNTISGALGASEQYAIFQNEQLVTLKAPDSNYNNSGSSYGANSPDIQGDDSTGDVKALVNNTLTSVAAYNGSSPASPAAGLLSQGYILPQLMQVEKAQDGLNQAGLPSQVVSNVNTGSSTQYNSSLTSTAAFTTMYADINSLNPSTVTSGTGSVYGANSLNTSSPSSFVSSISITSANYLFGNFNQNGIRDFSAAVVSAQKAQAALDASGYGNSVLSGNVSTSVVTTGIAALDAMPSQNGTASSSNTTGTGATKGDLIVMGDYNGDGAFDGRDLYDLAIGASLSDPNNRPVLIGSGSTATIEAGTGTITVPAGENFGQVIASSVLNKNVALDYLQDVTTPMEKQEARAVLTVASGTTAASIPAGATFVGNEDNTIGLAQYTYDPTGQNAYNKSDVNGDGVVDFNDAVIVDSLYGDSYTNQAESLTATEPTPVTGTPELANLVLAQQVDTNTSIGAGDLAVINAALTGGNLTTNWYAYPVVKSGPGTIIWQGSTGTKVNFYAGASFQISSGTVQVMSAMDPFTDNNTNLPASATDTSKSLAITVTLGGELEYTDTSTSGILLDRLSSLTIDNGGKVSVDTVADHADRTLLLVGGLSITSGTVATGVPTRPVGGGTLDLGNNDLDVQNGDLNAITSLVASAYTGGAWAGSGITSSAAANDTTHLTALGVISNSGPSGKLYGTGAPMGLFDGSNPAATDVLVKYTYYGDANLDGAVDASDYSLIDNGYLNGLTGWYNGDFNYDGVVNGSDYTLIDNAFNTQGASLAAQAVSPTVQIADEVAGPPAVVPEPTTLGLLGAGVGSLLGRRRRRA